MVNTSGANWSGCGGEGCAGARWSVGGDSGGSSGEAGLGAGKSAMPAHMGLGCASAEEWDEFSRMPPADSSASGGAELLQADPK